MVTSNVGGSSDHITAAAAAKKNINQINDRWQVEKNTKPRIIQKPRAHEGKLILKTISIVE